MFYNCHIHTFTDEDVPKRYLPLALVKILNTCIGYKLITGFLHNLIPFTKNDVLEKYIRFIDIGKLRDQKEILHECSKYYPDDTKFICLAIDMKFMGAGKPGREYKDQLKELGKLAQKDDRVIPFMMVDPRRPDVLDTLKEMVEVYGYKGIKLYPTMGYYPNDKRLDLVYSYCNEKKLSVMSHCGPYNPTYYKGKRSELIKMLESSNKPIEIKGKSKQELCKYFTHPSNYIQILEKYPDLKICLAHFGSSYYWDRYIHDPEDEDNWFTIIKDMLPKFENLYTDISFTMNHTKYFSLLKILLVDAALQKKILFGSDFYMVRTKSEERKFGLDLRAFIGEENFNLIARQNPEDYLA